MLDVSSLSFRLLSALAIGLLIGAERERRKGQGPSRSAAGIRTFGIVSLVGAVAVVIGGDSLLALSVAAIAALSTASYLRSTEEDPGLTTEGTLVLTTLLGGLAVHNPGVAAGIAVVVAVLLASRNRIHRFVSRVLSQEELNDALVFAATIFVILPLVPDRYIGPFHALNLHTIWLIVILMMTISSAGYIAIRLIGPKLGLPLAGLASGFISSTATIGAMGARTLREPALSRASVAGAVLSTVAMIVELAVVLGATSRPTLTVLAIPLIVSGTVALIYGLLFTMRTIRSDAPPSTDRGRPFNLKLAFLFAVSISFMLFVSAALNAWLGKRGVLFATTAAGFADTHSPAVSVGSLVSAGTLSTRDAVFPILGGLTTNTLTKMVLAITSGGRHFALQVIPGLVLVLLSVWATALCTQ